MIIVFMPEVAYQKGNPESCMEPADGCLFLPGVHDFGDGCDKYEIYNYALDRMVPVETWLTDIDTA